MTASPAEIERRLGLLEDVRERAVASDTTPEGLARRIARLESSLTWAFRMIVAAFIGFMFQGIVVLAGILGRHP